ncbi:hypothetical protein [Streptomyces sp. CA-179760]|uniref:hypothetical protein n=1 Tax=Streptomyces sp. CA-179760 TaxID=3240054 RepID=UPI003D90599C
MAMPSVPPQRRNPLFILLTVLVALAAVSAVVLMARAGDDSPDGKQPAESTSRTPAPSYGIPTKLPSELPSELRTRLPSGFPSRLPSDLPSDLESLLPSLDTGELLP